MGKRQRLAWANTAFVSLCKRGASRLKGLYKSDDGGASIESLAKMDDEGLLLSLVYAPNKVDAQGHYATSETIKDMAHRFAMNGMQLDVEHNRRPLGKAQAYVAESFIVQPGDPRFADWRDDSGQAVDATGGWALAVQINDPELRKLYREEGWDGTSLYAYPGEYQLIEEATPLAASAALDLHHLKSTNTDSDMTPQELEAALAKALSPVLADVAELKKAVHVDPKDAEIAALKKQLEEKGGGNAEPNGGDALAKQFPAPQLPKDLTNATELAKYQRDLAVHELAKTHDVTTLEGLQNFQAALAKMQGDDLEEEPTSMAALAKRAGIPVGQLHPVGGSSNTMETNGLAKSDNDFINQGLIDAGLQFDKRDPYVQGMQRQQAL